MEITRNAFSIIDLPFTLDLGGWNFSFFFFCFCFKFRCTVASFTWILILFVFTLNQGTFRIIVCMCLCAYITCLHLFCVDRRKGNVGNCPSVLTMCLCVCLCLCVSLMLLISVFPKMTHDFLRILFAYALGKAIITPCMLSLENFIQHMHWCHLFIYFW